MKYHIHNFDTLASTNDEADKTIYTDGDVIVATHQSKGRGQRGNTWHAKQGENLTFSLVIEPTHIHAAQQFIVSMTAAIAVHRTIESYGIKGTEIKWPNDIMVSGKKIAGILIEHNIMGSHLSRSIIGIGLNVLQNSFDIEGANPTSLSLLTDTPLDCAEVLERFLKNFDEVYSIDNPETLLELYTSHLYRRDGFHRYTDTETGEEFSAKITAIDPYIGGITLTLEDSTTRTYYFKEISFID